MSVNLRLGRFLVVCFLAGGTAPAVSAQSAAVMEDFSEEHVGAEPTSFRTPLGWWTIGTDGTDTSPLLYEDGTRYSAQANNLATQAQAQAQGVTSNQLADQSAAYAYYPVALFNKVQDFTQGTIVTRFAIVGGDLDTDAGIVFGYQPNGDFLALREDIDENQLILFSLSQGQSSKLSVIDNVPGALAQWHELQLTVAPGGRHVSGTYDGQHLLDADLSSPVSGQIGTIAKTDTVALFNTFQVDPNAQ
jgi:hypothetical protein